MQRIASIIGLVESRVEEYQRLHREVWEEVLAKIREVHIRNYSIYLRRLPDGNHYLFSYYEYHGDDYQADMDRMARDPVTQKWWEVCGPCQKPLPDVIDGEWWAPMQEVFHSD